ncbi:MAG: tetratricopeptide repeat protein [Halomonas subglaciescola]|nr:tetratricopeptide repeat protein [Halomonas subglaciescola]
MPLRATFIRATLFTRAIRTAGATLLTPAPRHLTLPALASAVLLAGCQAAPPASGAFGAPDDDILASAPPITRGLDAAGLKTLLTAEMAGQRGLYRDAGQGYLDAAKRYPDPALAERATFAARFGQSVALLQASAARWHELDPANTTPSHLLAALALEQGDWQQGFEQRLAIAAQGDSAELAALAEYALAKGAPPAPLIQQLNTFLADDRMPADSRAAAHLAAALLERARGNTAAAQTHLTRAQTLTPDSLALWRIKARLALEGGDYRETQHAAREGLKREPDDTRLALLLTQAELRLGHADAAEAQTNALLERHAGGRELRLALAQLYLEEDQPGAARRLLQPLASRDDISNMGYYLLGAADSGTGNVDSALLYFRQIEDGSEFIPARAAAASMLIDADRLTDARAFLHSERRRFEEHFSDLVGLEVELLDALGDNADADALIERELTRSPDDADLLYLRAMRAWQAGDNAGMERDIQRILKHDPDSVLALNALGYTLADEQVPGRLDDAQALVERAHQLAPDNPAVLDSLGWVYFRLGRKEDALKLLERAYKGMPDQEIAAHLAEVLNALGKRERARRLLENALEHNRRESSAVEKGTGHPAIDDLLGRHPGLAPERRD